MRKKEKEMNSREAIDKIIAACQVLRIGMCLNNRPYILPFSFGYDGASFFIHTAKTGDKIEYFIKNPLVCFELENNVKLVSHESLACKWTFLYQSIIGHGKIEEVTSDAGKRAGLEIIMKQYSDAKLEFEDKGIAATRIWKLNIDAVSGKESPEFHKMRDNWNLPSLAWAL